MFVETEVAMIWNGFVDKRRSQKEMLDRCISFFFWGGGGGGAGRPQKHKHGLSADNITCKVAQVLPDLLHMH